MTKKKYTSIQAQQILEEDKGNGTRNHTQIRRLDNIILGAEESSGPLNSDFSDLINPEDSGLQMPTEEESIETEIIYNSMIPQDVGDYTFAELS
jgi:hypothetical protein